MSWRDLMILMRSRGKTSAFDYHVLLHLDATIESPACTYRVENQWKIIITRVPLDSMTARLFWRKIQPSQERGAAQHGDAIPLHGMRQEFQGASRTK